MPIKVIEDLGRPFRYTFVRPLYDRLNLLRWRLRGRPIPPPYAVKRRTVLEYARRYSLEVLIETGTWHGDMMYFARSRFRNAYSIELDHRLFLAAQQRFRHAPNIRVIEGDSGVELPRLVRTMDRPVLFWLDAHFCKGPSARGVLDSPILQELQCIFDHPIRNHVVLIDDARIFNGEGGYPTIPGLREWVAQRRPDLMMEDAFDIVRITPRAG